MKLINHTLWYLSVILFTTVGLWGILFYFQLLKEIKVTIDDGLSNNKITIIDNLKDDSLIVEKKDFLDKNYIIKKVREDYALKVRETYKDTLIFSTLKQTNFQARLLSSAFVASNGNYYEIKVISHELNKSSLIQKIVFSISILFLFLFVSTIMVNKLALNKTWKPFYELLKYLNDFKLDKGKIRELSQTNIIEFTLLNESVQNLLKTNVDVFNSQKQFIANASHEIQTPLAIGINKLELLAGVESLSEEQIEQIGSIINDLRRLSGLNKSLLTLSKIENKQFIVKKLLSLDGIFRRIINDFSDYSKFQKIKIIYHKEADWIFKINENLAEMLIINLIKNAIIHNQIGGEVLITLTDSSFSIENTSTLSALSPDTIYSRFNKNSKNINSTGLGLAIVKAIVNVSSLVIDYSYNGKHRFTITKKRK